MIGIIGGYGNVGQWAARALLRYADKRIRVGGRNEERFRTWANTLSDSGTVEFMHVDFRDINSVKQFAEGCTIILNCSGPTYSCSSKLAEVILSMGIGYVDAGYDRAMSRIYEKFGDGKVLCKAGAIPGLSGLLPMYLAQQFDKVNQIEVYYCALGKFTKTAATDYLNGIFGNRTKVPLKRREEKRKLLPFSAEEAYLYPYYDEECEHVQQITKCDMSRWFMALAGECTNKFMFTAVDSYKADPDKAVKDLCMAAYVDTLGRSEYAGFVIQISGEAAGKQIIRTLLVKAPTAEYMTGIAAAASVILLNDKKELDVGGEPGKIKDVREFFEIFRRIGRELQINIQAESIEDLMAVEEGEI